MESYLFLFCTGGLQLGKEGNEFGDESMNITNRFYTSYDHFAVVEKSNMGRVPFSNQGCWEEFSFVKHCSITR